MPKPKPRYPIDPRLLDTQRELAAKMQAQVDQDHRTRRPLTGFLETAYRDLRGRSLRADIYDQLLRLGHHYGDQVGDFLTPRQYFPEAHERLSAISNAPGKLLKQAWTAVDTTLQPAAEPKWRDHVSLMAGVAQKIAMGRRADAAYGRDPLGSAARRQSVKNLSADADAEFERLYYHSPWNAKIEAANHRIRAAQRRLLTLMNRKQRDPAAEAEAEAAMNQALAETDDLVNTLRVTARGNVYSRLQRKP